MVRQNPGELAREQVAAGAGMIVGANAGNMSAMSLQRRYDIAYPQCMYAKGN